MVSFSIPSSMSAVVTGTSGAALGSGAVMGAWVGLSVPHDPQVMRMAKIIKMALVGIDGKLVMVMMVFIKGKGNFLVL